MNSVIFYCSGRINSVCTLLQCRKVPDLRILVQSMVDTTEVWPPNSMVKLTPDVRRNARATWMFVLEKVVSQGGPYAGYRKSEKLDAMFTNVRVNEHAQ